MKVIHDNDLGGIATIPLIIDWRISPICQVSGCNQETTTILCITADESPTKEAMNIGICEKHYLEGKRGDDEFRFIQVIETGYKERPNHNAGTNN